MNRPEGNRQVFTLLDARKGTRISEWTLGPDAVDLDTPQRWQVRKLLLHGGRQEGVDVVVVENGALSFSVVPTRGMNLWEAHCGDLRLGWDSPVTEVVHPRHVHLASRGGLGWLEGFGEWIARCGLESNGPPGRDQVRSNTGETVTVDLTLHGKISNLPASEVEVVVELPPARRLAVRGIVDEAMMFGPRLRLTTEISTEVGSSSLEIRDEVANLGARPQEMELLYHINFGRPLLEEGAAFLAPLRRVTPRDDRAAEGMEGWNRYGPPEPGYREQAYFLRLVGGARGETEVLLHNAAADRGVSLSFRLDELPCMTLWKNTAALEDGYVTGLEPATNYPNLRSVERRHGRVPVLQGGETYTAALRVAAERSAAEVRDAAARIRALQGATEAVVDRVPRVD